MKYDVIIVLAGGFKNNGEIPESVLKRVEKAKELFDQKYAPRMIMSGLWSTYWNRRHPKQTEATAMVEYALSLGMPKQVLLKEERSQNTKENAFFTKELFLKPHKWKKIIVVTSDFHVPRTRLIFNSLLGSEYTIQVEGSHHNVSIFKQLKWDLKEKILLYAERFF